MDSETAVDKAPTANTAAPTVTADEVTSRIQQDVAAKATAAAEQVARKVAGEQLKAIGAQLSGEIVDQGKQLVERIATDPIGYSRDLKEIAKREAKDELRAELRQEREMERDQVAAVQPFVNEYPELAKPRRLAMVEKLASDIMREEKGVPYREALKRACQATVEEFGMKSVTAAAEEAASNVGLLPLGSNVISGPSGKKSFDEAASRNSFIAGMRESALKIRKKGK